MSGRGNPISEQRFQLFGVCTNKPPDLIKSREASKKDQGVYDILWGSHEVRLIVLSEVPAKRTNALWNLFSADPEKVAFGKEHYTWKQTDQPTIINNLFQQYGLEGMDMAYTMADYRRECIEDALEMITPEEVMKKFSPEELLKDLSPNQVMKNYSPEERLKDLSLEQRLKGLSPEEYNELIQLVHKKGK